MLCWKCKKQKKFFYNVWWIWPEADTAKISTNTCRNTVDFKNKCTIEHGVFLLNMIGEYVGKYMKFYFYIIN